METICDECKHTFKRFSDLRKHVKKFHAEKLEELAPLKVKSYLFQCTLCQKNFSHKKHLNMHNKTHSTTENGSDPNNKKNEDLSTTGNVGKMCPLCDYVGKFKVDFIKHFQLVHNIDTEVENLHFTSSDNFNVWLSNIEKDTQTKFIIEKRAESKRKICVNYICHRSGFFKSKGAGIRHLKTQGSKKINGYCPAGMQVFIDKEGGKHNVTYFKTHVGHENDLSHLFLTKNEREMIATKIAMDIPFDDILDDIRDSETTSDLDRLHLLTKKDVFNIKACFNRHSAQHKEYNNHQLKSFENSEAAESSVILNHLESEESTSSQIERTLPGRKKELIEKIINEINYIESEKEMLTAEEIFASLGPTLSAVRHETDISIGHKALSRPKKIEQQRLFSTKTKNGKHNNRIQNTNPEEEETIKIIIY